jgi:hypothetical protein
MHKNNLMIKNMKKLVSLFFLLAGVAGILSGIFAEYLNTPEWFRLIFGDHGITLGFALGAASVHNISAEVLTGIRQWHRIGLPQMVNISNVLEMLTKHKDEWQVPKAYLDELSESYRKLQELFNKCSQLIGSSADRLVRNSLLKSTVVFCRTKIKAWAFSQYYAGVLTADDVHLMGFLLPGEIGGYRARKEPTKATAHTRAFVTHMDNILVLIDHAYKESAAHVKHGWPPGVHMAVIVITTPDGQTEIYNKITSRLHTPVTLPKSTRGKELIVKAAFLQHVGDTPKFAESQPVVSMPLTLEDLARKYKD